MGDRWVTCGSTKADSTGQVIPLLQLHINSHVLVYTLDQLGDMQRQLTNFLFMLFPNKVHGALVFSGSTHEVAIVLLCP